MRMLNRNKKLFFYALQTGLDYLVDDNGYRTGEKGLTYGDPVECQAYISAVSGDVAAQFYGLSERYDRVIILEDVNTPISEDTAIWIETEPDQPYNYVVRRVARALNSAAIAVSKVAVSA